MISVIADIASWILIVIGSLGLLAGGIGVLRLPDVYTRMHAASITDTLGAGAIIVGLMIQAGFTLVMVKLFFILVFFFFTSPTSSFSLAHAALSSGVDPVLDTDLRDGPKNEEETKEDQEKKVEKVKSENNRNNPVGLRASNRLRRSGGRRPSK